MQSTVFAVSVQSDFRFNQARLLLSLRLRLPSSRKVTKRTTAALMNG